MSVVPSHRSLVVLGLLGFVVACLLGPDLPASRPVAAADGDENKPTVIYFGVAACANKGCHGGDPPKTWIKGKDLLCRCDEAERWVQNDKHADAYRVLSGSRGKQMAKLLGYDVTKSPACLSCHAVVIKDKNLLKASEEARFRIEEGVNCVVCHGAAEDWVVQHGVFLSARKFRPLSREVKEKQFGMRDLWNPIKRAELCASCHVGNLDEGKFVTHEMYAAGHPPLPGFEAATFSNEMPRHWQYLGEKSESIQKELGLAPGEQEQTKLLLVGAAISLRESMRLLEKQAKQCLTAKDADSRAMDLANFDCYACHHDLKSPSWRQLRGYLGKPGRVPMRAWPVELARLGYWYLEQADAKGAKELGGLEMPLANLAAAFSGQPYGDPGRIEKAAASMAKWADGLARGLEAAPLDRDSARKVLAQVPALYAGKTARLLDFDSARMVGWSFEVIQSELAGGKVDPAVSKLLGQIDEQVKLRLPKGRKKLVEDDLGETLRKLNEYDPSQFRRLLTDLSRALK